MCETVGACMGNLHERDESSLSAREPRRWAPWLTPLCTVSYKSVMGPDTICSYNSRILVVLMSELFVWKNARLKTKTNISVSSRQMLSWLWERLLSVFNYSSCNWLSDKLLLLWISKCLPVFLCPPPCVGGQQRDPAFGRHPEERRLGHSDPSLPRPRPHRPHQWPVQFAHSAQTDGDGRHPEEDSRGPRIKGQPPPPTNLCSFSVPTSYKSIHHLPFCLSAGSQWGLDFPAVVLEALLL